MASEWKRYCHGSGLKAEESVVVVSLDTGRKQLVRVEDGSESFRLISLVVKRAVMEKLPNASLDLWQLNRGLPLVGFRVDQKGNMVGETWVPKQGLNAEEFEIYVKTLASDCDRLEHQLTGRDMV
jgi:hypothetical protein